MANLLNTCNSFFEISVPECITTLLVSLGLGNAETGFAILTDKFGKEYVSNYTCDAEGSFEIDLTTLLGEGTFNRYAGDFTLSIKKRLEYCNPESFSICGVEYESIVITPTHTYPCDTTFEIPCTC